MKNVWLKYILWAYVIFPAVALSFGIGLFKLFESSDLWEKKFEVWLIGGAVAISLSAFIHYRLMSIKCPKCNKSLYPYDRISDYFNFNTTILRKRCRGCGYDLTGRSNKE